MTRARRAVAQLQAALPGVEPAPRKRFKLTSQEAPEAAVLDAVLDYLPRDRRVWQFGRFNSGTFFLANADGSKRKFQANTLDGCPDVIVFLRNGRFAMIETKRRSGKARPNQAALLASAAGAPEVVAGLVRTLPEAIALLDRAWGGEGRLRITA